MPPGFHSGSASPEISIDFDFHASALRYQLHYRYEHRRRWRASLLSQVSPYYWHDDYMLFLYFHIYMRVTQAAASARLHIADEGFLPRRWAATDGSIYRRVSSSALALFISSAKGAMMLLRAMNSRIYFESFLSGAYTRAPHDAITRISARAMIAHTSASCGRRNFSRFRCKFLMLIERYFSAIRTN